MFLGVLATYPVFFSNETGNLSIAIENDMVDCMRFVLQAGEVSECASEESRFLNWRFLSLLRPNWTLGDSPQPGSVFLGSVQWAEVSYMSPPVVNVTTPVESSVDVRSFARPGWSAELGRFACTNCTAHNVLAVTIASPTPCVGRPQELSVFTSPDLREIPLLPVSVSVDMNSVSFWTNWEGRLSPDGRRAFLSRSLQLCFFSSVHAVSGVPVGSVTFQVDSVDSEVFVFLILFFLLFYPLMCVVAWAINSAKMSRMMASIRNIRDHIQSQQLEYELISRTQPYYLLFPGLAAFNAL